MYNLSDDDLRAVDINALCQVIRNLTKQVANPRHSYIVVDEDGLRAVEHFRSERDKLQLQLNIANGQLADTIKQWDDTKQERDALRKQLVDTDVILGRQAKSIGEMETLLLKEVAAACNQAADYRAVIVTEIPTAKNLARSLCACVPGAVYSALHIEVNFPNGSRVKFIRPASEHHVVYGLYVDRWDDFSAGYINPRLVEALNSRVTRCSKGTV